MPLTRRELLRRSTAYAGTASVTGALLFRTAGALAHSLFEYPLSELGYLISNLHDFEGKKVSAIGYASAAGIYIVPPSSQHPESLLARLIRKPRKPDYMYYHLNERRATQLNYPALPIAEEVGRDFPLQNVVSGAEGRKIRVWGVVRRNPMSKEEFCLRPHGAKFVYSNTTK